MIKKIQFLTWLLALMIALPAWSQETYKDVKPDDETLVYKGGDFYPVKTYPQQWKGKKPKNIVLLIGDGMGVSQVFAGITANGGKLFLDNFKHIGFNKTSSSSHYITDSAAGGTALAAGVKTYNGAIGVDPDKNPVKSILHEAIDKGLSGGLVSTSAITHATPASFIAHQAARSSYEAIAADFLKTEIDVFIGGGYKHFTDRQDGRNLAKELEAKGYKVLQSINEIAEVTSGKLAGLTVAEHNGRIAERKDMLPVATKTALNILSNNKKGFFLMIEGSQIDWAGHAKNTSYAVEDMLDFDKTIGQVLEFAAADGHTLVIVTADHETGGMAITGGDYKSGMVKGSFPVTDHTAVMVPVFAWGPGADEFMGIMENTDINKKMKKLLLNK
jgi:alkaline phosphatase